MLVCGARPHPAGAGAAARLGRGIGSSCKASIRARSCTRPARAAGQPLSSLDASRATRSSSDCGAEAFAAANSAARARRFASNAVFPSACCVHDMMVGCGLSAMGAHLFT
eukprot:scaffold21778_cov131-Isochrysis_galbana.AAC.10